MSAREPDRTRRRVLGALAGALLPGVPSVAAVQNRAPVARAIPASDERLPAIGVGTWITFDVVSQPAEAALARITVKAGLKTLLTAHPLYLGLGPTDTARQAAYGRYSVTNWTRTIGDIRMAINQNQPLGNERPDRA